MTTPIQNKNNTKIENNKMTTPGSKRKLDVEEDLVGSPMKIIKVENKTQNIMSATSPSGD